MVQINFASREVNCKIVYYGPGRCGKTTNLQVVHAKAPQNSTGELVSIATETDRTLYFDFLPLDLGTVAGMRTKFQLYTVPGQVYYDATRKLVLQGCDGVVFVADSNPDMMAENIESLDNLAKNLAENGLDIMEMPLVLQYNKRDLPNPMSVEDMNAKMNRNNWPTVEAVAVNGDGVFQTLKVISQQVIRRLNREQGYAEDGTKRAKAGLGMKAPTTVAPPPPPPPPSAPPPPPPAPPPPPPAAVAPPPPRPAPPPPPAAPPPAPVAPPAPPAPPSRPAPPPPAQVAAAAVEAPPEPAPVIQNVQTAPPPQPDPRTKTEIFRDRMAEIKKNQASASGASEDAVPAGPPEPAPAPKKKGCFGMIVLGFVLVSGAVAGSWTWLF